MSSNLQNSIWPNTDGNLGNIKVQIPDGVNTFWPDGDALVHNFVFKDGKLAGFVDTKALTVNDTKSTTINYDYVDIELPFTEGEIAITRGERSKYFNVRYSPINDDNVIITLKYKGCKTVNDVIAIDPDYLTNDIVDGVWNEGLGDLTYGYEMFYTCTNLTSFSSDLSSLTNGNSMFQYCSNLTSFSSDLSSLTNGSAMFQYCSNLTSFSSDLSSLSGGSWMFASCTNLTSFSSDISSLWNGYQMFIDCKNLASFTSDLSSLTDGTLTFYKCSKLTSFNSDLSSLTRGPSMFGECRNLTSFNSDLSSLTNGKNMFQGCYNLTSFSSDLSSLTDGSNMFIGCKLDTPSVQSIADTINTVTNNPLIHIWVENINDNQIYFEQMRQKGWDVLVIHNSGSCGCASCCASLTTLDETDGEFIAPKPYWAKPVPSDEQNAQYIDSEGNFYNILGGDYIYVHDPEEYGMFTSLEDAAAQMRLTKIGEEEIETA